MHRDIPPEAGPPNTNWAAGPSQEPVGKPMPTGSSKAKGKTKPRGKDDFPADVPSLDASVEDWIKYIHHWHQHNDGALRAFPGVIRCTGCIDDSEDEAPEPLARNVRGLLFVEQLMPQMGWNVGQVGWCRSMARLLGVAGRYCSIIEWVGLSPAVGQMAEWVGSCESSAYTLTRVAAYLAANGVTYHDADNAWAWGQTHLQELWGWYLGDDNPELDTMCNEVEADARHASGEAVSHSREQILALAVS